MKKTTPSMKSLISSQQLEIDIVGVYKDLADKATNERIKILMLGCAASEAKHAAYLKKITGKTLLPRPVVVKAFDGLYKIAGRRTTFMLLAAGEKIGGDGYKKLIAYDLVFKEMAKDEYHHFKFDKRIAKLKDF